MFEDKLIRNCATCGDEVMYCMSRLIERNGIEYFIYADEAGHTIERRITSPQLWEQIEAENIVLWEVIPSLETS